MKSKIAIFTISIFIGIADIIASNPVEIQCTHYMMSITNRANHSLKISLRKKGKEIENVFLLTPNETKQVLGRYTTYSLKNTTIRCIYDYETYNEDKKQNENSKEDAISYLKGEVENRQRNLIEEIQARIGAFAFSEINVKANDYSLYNICKAFFKTGGTAALVVFSINDFLQELSNKKYNNYIEFIEDLVAKKVKDELINEISESLQNQIKVKAKVNKYLINVYLHYIEEVLKIEEYNNIELLKISQDYLKSESELQNLLNDKSFASKNVYQANAIIVFRDLKRITPSFYFNLDPFNYGSSLNENWKVRKDGFGDKYLGMHVGFVISPEMRMGSSLSRFYAQIGYHIDGYELRSDTFLFSNSFFSQVPMKSTLFTVSSPIRFDHNNITAILNWKCLIKQHVLLDIHGGIVRQTGTLNLKYSKLSTGYEWAHDKIKIADEQYVPSVGGKLGYGMKHNDKGLYFTIGLDVIRVNHRSSNDYTISYMDTKLPISYASNKQLYKVFLGMQYTF